MYRALASHPTIEKYLRAFPKHQWDKGVEVTLLLGIQAASAMLPGSLSLESLTRLVESRRLEVKLDSALKPEREKPKLTTAHSYLDTQDLEKPHESDSIRKAYDRQPTTGYKPVSRYRPKEDVRRFLSPQRLLAEDRSESRIMMSEVQRKHTSPSPSESPRSQPLSDFHRFTEREPRASPASVNSSKLIEPRTNAAYLDHLSPSWNPCDSSILRITDRFLSDPFLTTLSSRISPKRK